MKKQRVHILVRVLRVDARLNGVAVDLQILLLDRQLLASGNLQLQLHQVLLGDQLRHWVLYLKTRVHLHEVERLVLIEQELDGASADVPDRLGSGDSSVAHLLSQSLRHVRLK